MANKVTLTFAGDADQLTRTFSSVASDADTMSRGVASSTKFDTAIEGFDTLDTRAMGFRDTITGVQDTATGFSMLAEGDMANGLLTLGMGIGDLASGFVNLILPMGQYIATHAATVAATVAGWATTAAAAVAGAATQVGAWIALGVQSLISAAQVAAAWLLSIWPIALIIAAVVGLAYLIYRNWDTIKNTISAGWTWVKETSVKVWNAITSFIGDVISRMVSTVRGHINAVKNIFTTLVSAAKSILSGLANILLAPFKKGFQGIKDAWNNSIGGKGFTAPDWVPGIGGKGFTIPKLAAGGFITSPTLALIGEAGPEAVVPLDRMSEMGGGGPVTIHISSGGTALDQVLLEVLRKAIRNQGGGVVGVLG